MKNDKNEQLFIKHVKDNERKNYWKLPNNKLVWLLIGSIIMAIAFSLIWFECHPWLSSVFISAGCGIFTGLVLYFLTNIRANTSAKVQIEYEQLKRLYDLFKEIDAMGWYYTYGKKIAEKHRNVHEDVNTLLLKLVEIRQVKKDISRELWQAVGFSNCDPLSYDEINRMIEASECYENNNDLKNWIIWVNNEIQPIADKIHQPLQDRTYQIAYLSKSFF